MNQQSLIYWIMIGMQNTYTSYKLLQILCNDIQNSKSTVFSTLDITNRYTK